MKEDVKKAIEFARSHASTGGPESITALLTLAGEVERLREAVTGALAIVEICGALNSKPTTEDLVVIGKGKPFPLDRYNELIGDANYMGDSNDR